MKGKLLIEKQDDWEKYKMFFKDKKLDTSKFSDEIEDILLESAKLTVESRSPQLRPGHLLLAIFEHDEGTALELIDKSLVGCTIQDIKEAIKSYLWDDVNREIPNIDFSMNSFSPEVQNIFKHLELLVRDKEKIGIPSVTENEITPTYLLLYVLYNLDSDDKDILGGGLNAKSAIEHIKKVLNQALKQKSMQLFDSEGKLRTEYFDIECFEVIKMAMNRAGQMGYSEIRPPHIFIALLNQTDGTTIQAVRLQVKPGVGIKTIINTIEHSINLGQNIQEQALKIETSFFSTSAKTILNAAMISSLEDEFEKIDENHLLKAILIHGDSKTKNVLQSPPMELNIMKMLEFVDERIRITEPGAKLGYKIINWNDRICPASDLTQLARDGKLEPLIGRKAEIEEIKQALFKLENHNVLIYGEQGIGKTALIKGLAVKIADGNIDFLKERPLLSIDISGLNEEDIKTKIQQIFTLAESQPWGIYFIDGIDKPIRINRRLFQDKLKNKALMFIGILSTEAYTDLVAYDEVLRERFTSFELKELSKDETVEVLQRMKKNIEREYGVSIDDKSLEKATKLSHDFIMNERLPAKAIKILKSACDSTRYEIQHNENISSVTPEHIVNEVARVTGLPKSMIEGVGEERDYFRLLRKMVVGQDDVVQAVADKLDLIQKGMVEKNKPAGIFIFAGLTGTGKTELAKAMAKVYSNSKKLIIYPMENFPEDHSISGLIGVPPGYVGHDQGGRLINELNADPYSVVLLDEIEKAHPDIWNPFLNLFAEGWIEDRRGVIARGNKAFFVLTSNLCADLIYKQIQYYGSKGEDPPMDIIKDNVKKELAEAKNIKTGRPCFSAEFLGRIQQIFIFRPLDLKAIRKIVLLKLKTLKNEWKESREIDLVFRNSLVKLIASLSHEDNIDGKQGGRAVEKRVESMIAGLLAKKIREIHGANKVIFYANNGRIEIEKREERETLKASTEEKVSTEDIIINLHKIAGNILKVSDTNINKMNSKQIEKLMESIQKIQKTLDIK